MKNENELIKSTSLKQLTAKGLNLEHRLCRKACLANNIHPYDSAINDQVKFLFRELVFNHNFSYDQLNQFYKSIKVIPEMTKQLTSLTL